MMRYVKGDSIKLRAFGGKCIVRRFVEERGGSILICSHEEYSLALREERGPLCIGFRPEDVIKDGALRRRRPTSPRSTRSRTKATNANGK